MFKKGIKVMVQITGNGMPNEGTHTIIKVSPKRGDIHLDNGSIWNSDGYSKDSHESKEYLVPVTQDLIATIEKYNTNVAIVGNFITTDCISSLSPENLQKLVDLLMSFKEK